MRYRPDEFKEVRTLTLTPTLTLTLTLSVTLTLALALTLTLTQGPQASGATQHCHGGGVVAGGMAAAAPGG